MCTQSAFARVLIFAFFGVTATVGVNLADCAKNKNGKGPTVTYSADPWDDEVESLTGNDAMNIYTPDSQQINGQPQNIGGGQNSGGVGAHCNNPGVQCR
ncbi:hypothetical protein BKG76_07120 [Mycobacteroides franklinii]|uniref:Uncharacterized protein n=1 Tax=Mycobacteroides franklinii TaxID=948102 RepID=A0A1S1LBQ2_9MYCO|nr:hypothetical protein [Mycobacteroides franklinii]OHU26882.1 hypothetical protein BKG76_07120 [Mycobacteroides franklinii]